MQDASEWDLKRKLLTRGIFDSLSQSWSRIVRITGEYLKSLYVYEDYTDL